MTTQITSPHNERVKAAVRLRDRKGREEQRRIIIDGAREISRATHAGVVIEELYWDTRFAESRAGQEVLAELARSTAARFECMPNVFGKLAYGDRDSGLIAVAKTPATSLAAFSQRIDRALAQPNGKPALIGVLEGVEKPGNVGAVLRTADAAGINGLIIADGGTDVFNPNAIRASAGAIFTVPVAAATSAQALAWLRERSLQIVTTRVDAATNYTAIDYRIPTAIILGSEAPGLSNAWQGADIRAVSLPMLGQVDSLNVSVTAAVIFYEALRQRSV